MESADSKHLEDIASVFIRLGAERAQAEVMAKQLFKRAKQISEERNISELEALEGLLKRVIEAREGS